MSQRDLMIADTLTLQEAFRGFCEIFMAQKDFSLVTRRGYAYDLSEWLAATQIIYVKDLTTQAIQYYMSVLDAKGLKGSTRHRKIAAIKTFLFYLEQEEVLPKDFNKKLIWPQVSRDEPRALSTSEYTAILREAAHDPRDSAMFELLLQTGIRLSELTALTLDDVTLPVKPSNDPVNGYGLLRVKRKGRRLQELILNYKACRAIKSYLRTRPKSSTQALFLTKYGEPMTNRSVQKAFKKYALAAGVPWAHVHTLRTTHITHHIASKTDIKTVQGNAGHASLATTNYYASYVKEAQIRAMQDNAL